MSLEITDEGLKALDLDVLALNQDFGRLNFSESLGDLKKVRALFVDLDELGYKTELTKSEVDLIENHKRRFLKKLNQLSSFNIGQSDSQSQHDSLVNEFRNLRDSIEKELRSQLVYLRLEATNHNIDTEELQKLQKEAAKNRREYEELTKQLKTQLDELAERQKDIANKKGEVAAQVFGRHFETSATKYSITAENWLKIGSVAFVFLSLIVLGNFVTYLILFIRNLHDATRIEPSNFFSLEYGIVKFTLLLLLSYIIGFASRQYSVNQHLSVLNVHRKNVAETMRDFYESDLAESAKTQIIEYGTEAMFKNLPIGHISKSEGRDHDGPIHQIVNQIPVPKINS